ncbi:hypothetical protein P3T73_12330 [Kiritimatiellota bacterium B12222]|nr:hypothetical protein P3T73_12330 [Kiritimatiellota bacterium B12222]
MYLNAVVKFFILLVWMGTFGWLIRYEAFPHLFDDTVDGYRELARHLPALRDTWMKVESGGKHVGYVNSSIEMVESEGEEQLLLNTQLLLRMRIYGELSLLRLNSEVKLDARQKLVASLSTFSLGEHSGRLSILPIAESKKFEMSVQFNDFKILRQIDIPRGAVISSPLMDAGLRTVKVGGEVNIRTLDPFSMSGELHTVAIKGISTSQQLLPGEDKLLEVTQVEMKIGEMILHAEVDEYGRIVRQDTPFGVEFVLSEASHAMKIPQGNYLDPLTLMSTDSLSSFIKLPGTL